ncbi:MAG: hypothetical protein AVDCRST_MAG66-1696 [uncultured Pseudonocardia sp.]|uniref:Uncharacterized protein n=1 Tax=uncultured Pseudonocardia sp. TaxID=211455 RepID=A0A6J4P8J2_9PSEU|nr:MAG: hypothetical protein AVDCRST_MAG66-1696 [uncultured Pseudonocardia sp.]
MALLLGAADADDDGAAEDAGAAADGSSELLQAPRATARAAVALMAASRWIFRTGFLLELVRACSRADATGCSVSRRRQFTHGR